MPISKLLAYHGCIPWNQWLTTGTCSSQGLRPNWNVGSGLRLVDDNGMAGLENQNEYK